jgi:hypothetical protein
MRIALDALISWALLPVWLLGEFLALAGHTVIDAAWYCREWSWLNVRAESYPVTIAGVPQPTIEEKKAA